MVGNFSNFTTQASQINARGTFEIDQNGFKIGVVTRSVLSVAFKAKGLL